MTKMNAGGRPIVIQGDMNTCWSCGGPVAQRALFCHACGAVQPPRDIDAFARLGLPRRFDLAAEDIERQSGGFLRTLDPARFKGRGPRERGFAEDHRVLLEEARRALRDPLSRALLLLELVGAEPSEEAAEATLDADMLAFGRSVAAAQDAASVDQLAHRAARDIEDCVTRLSAAFRAGDLGMAGRVASRLETLQSVAEAARRRRAALSGGSSQNESYGPQDA